ncbi:GNAT family N-acetyltransferase [Lysinibacillus sp. NPDC097287]|uniref:GNAT family N-acetyltransferase n=1 Tax=Lysinibacillus sp. NPDC097287 TaxID=3364144 RepID=UPI0037FD939B
MNVELVKMELRDVHLLQAMQKKAFQPLLDKYKDYETNPVNESLERLTEKILSSSFFKITADNEVVGAIRIVQRNNSNWIRPIFILPEYQGKGIAQKAMILVEDLFSEYKTWQLQTILQEKGNCYLYEKMGYRRTDFERPINSKMTIIGYKK